VPPGNLPSPHGFANFGRLIKQAGRSIKKGRFKHHAAPAVDQERASRSGRHIKQRERLIILLGGRAAKTARSEPKR
jgi:hypothetical protein